MDPEQLIALLAAAGAGLGAIGLRRRQRALDAGRRTTAGMALGRAGAGSARQAGNVTAVAGRIAADSAAAGIRVSGAAAATTVGLVVDGTAELSRQLSRARRALLRRPGALQGALDGDEAQTTELPSASPVTQRFP